MFEVTHYGVDKPSVDQKKHPFILSLLLLHHQQLFVLVLKRQSESREASKPDDPPELGSSWLQNLRQETWLSTQKVDDRGVDNVSNNITDKNGTIWDDSDLDNDDTVPMPVIVGIAGGSGSGKTTLTQAIMDALGHDRVTYISHDSYYKDLSHLSLEDRAGTNFDHPESLDTELLCKHMEELKDGKEVDVPIYDFKTHSRTTNVQRVYPRRVIIIDGILIFAEERVLDMLDIKIFVDTDDDIRLIRRLTRDMTERQRTMESVIAQYLKTVRPMHRIFVEPSKRRADIIVPAEDMQTVALDMCVSRLREIINRGSDKAPGP